MLASLWPPDTSARLHLLTLAAFACVEAAVFTSFYATLPVAMRQADEGVVCVVVWCALMALALFRRAAPAIATTPQALRAANIVAYLPLLLICVMLLDMSFSGLALAVLLALALWWRGLSLGSSSLHPQDARQHFWWGLGIVTAFLAFDFKLVRIDLLAGLTGTSMLALMLSQLNNVAQNNDISPSALTRPAWRRALSLVLLVVVALIGLDAMLLNSEVAAWVVRGLILLIAVPVGLALGLLLKLLAGLLPASFLDGLQKALRQIMLSMNSLTKIVAPQVDKAEPVASTGTAVDPRVVLFGIILGGVVLVLLLLAGSMGLRRATKRRRQSGAMPTIEPSTDDHENDAELDLPGRLGQTFSRWFAAATIRLIYARMAREATKRGFTRKPSQTTQEFLPALQQAFAAGEADVRLISDAYEAAHYGQVPDTLDQLSKIREAWERVKQIPPTPKGESLASTTTAS